MLWILDRRIGGLELRDPPRIVKMLAAPVMGAVCLAIQRSPLPPQETKTAWAIQLVLVMGAGGFVYLGLCSAMGIAVMGHLLPNASASHPYPALKRQTQMIEFNYSWKFVLIRETWCLSSTPGQESSKQRRNQFTANLTSSHRDTAAAPSPPAMTMKISSRCAGTRFMSEHFIDLYTIANPAQRQREQVPVIPHRHRLHERLPRQHKLRRDHFSSGSSPLAGSVAQYRDP